MIEVLRIINWAFEIYSWLIIIYIFMSWVPAAYESKIGRILAKIVNPYLDIFRRFIPPIGMIDISAIIAIFALNFIQRGVNQLFYMFFF